MYVTALEIMGSGHAIGIIMDYAVVDYWRWYFDRLLPWQPLPLCDPVTNNYDGHISYLIFCF